MSDALIRNAKQLWTDIRQDSEALFELRQLMFGIVIALVVTYGFYVLHVQDKEQVKQKNIRVKRELAASLGGSELDRLLTGQLEKLQKSKIQLTENIGLLQFQETILREQYVEGNSDIPFANIIFTLLPLSPVDIESGFVKMNVLENRPYEFFDINPISLQGEIDYAQFVYYLQYLEERDEVGMIGNISLQLLAASPLDYNNRVQFNIELGRVQLLPGK